MLGSIRGAIRRSARLPSHDCAAKSTKQLHLNKDIFRQQYQQMILLSSRQTSVQSLISPQLKPAAITESSSQQSDAEEMDTKVNKWMEDCVGKSNRTVEAMLEGLLDSFGQIRQSMHYKSGELYISILSHVQSTISTDYSRQIMGDYLQQQTFGALGNIYMYADEKGIEWLKDAAREKMLQSIGNIAVGHELVSAYTYLKRGILPKEVGLQLEAKTKELTIKLSTKNIIKILHLLALMKYRSVSLIGSLVYALHQNPSLLASASQLSSLYFAASTLRISSPRMLLCLEALSNTLLTSVTDMPPSDVINMVLSMGKMRWNNAALLTFLCKSIQEPQQLTVTQFANVISTCSVIGVLPDNIKQHVVHQLKAASTSPEDVQCYLDIAWSLLVFGIKSEAICKDLLTDSRIYALTKDVAQHTAESNCSKLLNICTTARMEYGVEMPDALRSFIKLEPATHHSAYHNQLGEKLVECLNCDAAQLERAVWYPTGNFVDFRYLYDTAQQKVVAPTEYKTPYDVEPGDKLEPTTHMKWVAVLGNTYQHFTIGLSHENPLEGRRRLAETQLNQMGYHTIMVNEDEFKVELARRKLQWLKEKISLGKE